MDGRRSDVLALWSSIFFSTISPLARDSVTCEASTFTRAVRLKCDFALVNEPITNSVTGPKNNFVLLCIYIFFKIFCSVIRVYVFGYLCFFL